MKVKISANVQLHFGILSQKELYVPTLILSPNKRPPWLTAILVLDGVVIDVVADLHLVTGLENPPSML